MHVTPFAHPRLGSGSDGRTSPAHGRSDQDRASPRPPPPRTAPFLVIAPEQFHAALKDFVAYKQRLMPVELVALEPC
jgi:hypothetical protein